jgi:hypothetical protein
MHRSECQQISLFHLVTTSGHSISSHPLPSRCAIWGFPDHRAYRRYRLADDSHPCGSCVIWASPFPSRLATAAGRIEFAAVGFRQPVLRTGRSPPVAPHPASWRRSYLRLRGARRTPARTFTSQMSRTYRRTRTGFRARPNCKSCGAANCQATSGYGVAPIVSAATGNGNGKRPGLSDFET